MIIICLLVGGRMIHVWKLGTVFFILWNKGWIMEITHIISDLTREWQDKWPVILVGLEHEKHNTGGKINFTTSSPGSFCACFIICRLCEKTHLVVWSPTFLEPSQVLEFIFDRPFESLIPSASPPTIHKWYLWRVTSVRNIS